jgi:AraC-like DNA-binding protein
VKPICGHLTIRQCHVPAGSDLAPQTPGWSFFRVCAGHGFVVDRGQGHALNHGDLVVLPAHGKPSLRSSQTCALRFCHYGVRPEQLTGVFTLREMEVLRTGAQSEQQTVRVFPATHEVAKEYAVICQERVRERAAVVRCTMLRLAVVALRDLLDETGVEAAPMAGPEVRLAALVARLSEAELLKSSAADLARQCHCSERHLRRLFQQRYGLSLLRRQIQMRIEHAKVILRERDAKIIEVAEQCGFQSLALFNATFKKLTGKTPTDWRQSDRTLQLRLERKLPPLCPFGKQVRRAA